MNKYNIHPNLYFENISQISGLHRHKPIGLCFSYVISGKWRWSPLILSENIQKMSSQNPIMLKIRLNLFFQLYKMFQ